MEWGGILRKASLRNYCNKKYNQYWNKYYVGPKYFNKVLLLSKKDMRLAIVAQAFYCSIEKFNQANKFSYITGDEFLSNQDFINSKTKYVMDFKSLLKNRKNAKEFYKLEIIKKMKLKKTNLNKISKTTSFTKSKLYEFFNDGIFKAMSLEKLEDLLNYLS